MKKIFKGILFLLFWSIMILPSFADLYGAKSKISEVDQKKMELAVVDLTLEGKKINSDVPSVIYKDRTLIPVRAVAENLGAKIGWSQKNQEVTIQTSDKTMILKINSSKVRVNGEVKNLPDNVPAKILTYQENGRTMVPARFIVEQLGKEINWDAKNRVVNIKNVSEKPVPPVVEKFNSVEKIQFDKNQVLITTKESAEYTETFMSSPERLVLDFTNSKNNVKTEVINVNNDFIKEIRTSQFMTNPNISRVVIEFEAYNGYDINKNANVIKINVKSPEKPVEKPSNIVNIAYDSKKDTLKVNSRVNLDFKSFFLENPNRLILDIYGSKIDSGYEERDFSAENLKSYKAYYYPEENRTRIVLTINEKLSQKELKLDKQSTNLIIYFKTQDNSKPVDPVIPPTKPSYPVNKGAKTIVVDPGHGGTDPGTRGTTIGLLEKNVAMDISKNLVSSLRSKGYNVLQTRETDVKIDLTRRAQIANELDADMFVSIHLNSASSSASGIETLFYPEEKRNSTNDKNLAGLNPNQKLKQNSRNNKELAQIIQKNMIKDLGAVNRGIVERPNLVVLRETMMPAVLVECGFLSNPSEESKMNTDEYKRSVAESIASSIDEYFKSK